MKLMKQDLQKGQLEMELMRREIRYADLKIQLLEIELEKKTRKKKTSKGTVDFASESNETSNIIQNAFQMAHDILDENDDNMTFSKDHSNLLVWHITKGQ